MDFFDRQSYRLNKMVLYGIGLWPYQSFNSKLITRTVGTLGIACFCLPQIIHVFDVINDFDGLFEALPTLFGGFIATVKTVGLITKSNKMKALLDRIPHDWNNMKLEAEIDIMEEYAMKGRQMSLGYAIFAAGPMMIFVTVPLCVPLLDLVKPLNESRRHVFAYPGEYFVDEQKYAVYIEMSQFIGCFFALTVAVGADTLFIILMHHVCAMFAILSYRLRNITEYRRFSDENENISVDSQDYRHMMECIRLHTRTIKFSEVIVSTFGVFFFFDLGLGLLLQCASCVMIVIQMDNRAQLVKYATLLLGQSLRLFFNSWIGQELLDHSYLVRNAAYNGLWYEMSTRARRLLLLLQLRCEIPCKVTIAKLYVIDYQGFSMVIRTSMSYCTVMTSVRDSVALTIVGVVMGFFDAPYFRINKLLLLSVGLWPYQGTLSRVLTLAIGIFGLCSLCVPQSLFVLDVLTDLQFESVFSSLPTFFGGLIAAAKAISFWYKSNEVKCLLARMKNDWDSVTAQSEVKILVTYAKDSRRLTWGYAIFATGPIMAFVSLPFAVPLLDIILPLNQSRPRMLAYPAKYFVDQDEHYYALQTNEWLGCFISLTVTAAADTLYVMLIQHVCGMFALSSYRMQHLTGPGEGDWPDNKTDPIYQTDYEQMINCIKLHTNTIKFAEIIDSTFSAFFICDIGFGLVTQSASCIMIVVRVDKKTEAFRYGAIVMGQSLRLFFNSWIGQRLIDHSLNVFNAAYDSEWYKTSCKTKKLLLRVMMRCRSPCKVTIAKLYVMSLEGFSKVVRASLSYCTVMTSIRESQML